MTSLCIFIILIVYQVSINNQSSWEWELTAGNVFPWEDLYGKWTKEAKEESEWILREARRRKRKRCNTIIIN